VTETTVAAELIGNFIDEHEIKGAERRGATVEWMERGVRVCAAAMGDIIGKARDLHQAACGDCQE
jgi:hypothetical protein